MTKTVSLFRRQLVLGAPLALIALSVTAGCGSRTESRERLANLEKTAGGRLGVCFLDSGAREVHGHRLDERFALCSTFKLPLVALILREVDAGRLDRDEFIPFTEQDMVPWAPVTETKLAAGGMTLLELAEAAQLISDNVAANLLLEQVGGPQGFTSALRKLGDETTRLDRMEPELNFVPPGDIRDTTTPRAMAESVARLVLGDELASDSQTLLERWMRETKTGRKRLRAGLPDQWAVGTKSGTGFGDGTLNRYNDVAVVWPEGEQAFVIAAYYEADGAYEQVRDEDQAVLAEVGRIAKDWIAPD